MQGLAESYEAAQALFEAADFVSALSLIKKVPSFLVCFI